jgi:hypothetical protein
MNNNAKAALAIAVPGIGLFVGAMMLRGPQPRLGRLGATSKPKTRDPFVFVEWRENGQYHGGNYRQSHLPEIFTILKQRRARGAEIKRVLVDEKEAVGALDGADRSLEAMTPSEINRRLDRLDKMSSKLSREFIDAGRGYEKPSETRTKNDPLAERYNRLAAEQDELHAEIARRYGPGAPSRLPTRQAKSVGRYRRS